MASCLDILQRHGSPELCERLERRAEELAITKQWQWGLSCMHAMLGTRAEDDPRFPAADPASVVDARHQIERQPEIAELVW